ncbi:DUF7734 family protein [Thalassoporum mexicanum]|uniref:DUF7734 family protein n=1 Tax=Thalassoporum mexicanum TaxID=3457544 RepID=UPI00030BD96E|nr:hypothetical protein [Pseudanabaena sp. PCC 7367]
MEISMVRGICQRLEEYSIKYPQEVLFVRLEADGHFDEVAIFKGFSSSLMHPTAFDPDMPVIPDDAKILEVDRAKAPYNPKVPEYIERNITWAQFKKKMAKAGIKI